jgi:hypothetical protein
MKLRATLAAICAAALCCAALPALASADFGLHDFHVTYTQDEAGTLATQAASHPFAMETSFGINFHEESGVPVVDGGDIRDLLIEQIKGLAGDTTAVPTCSTLDFATNESGHPACADKTAVGILAVVLNNPEDSLPTSLYNLAPPPGVPVRLGFVIAEVPVVIDVGLKTSPDYNVIARQTKLPQPLTVFGAVVQIWGVPADPAHDFARGACANANAFAAPPEYILAGRLDLKEGAEREAAPQCPAEGAPQRPLLTLPRSCRGPLATRYEASPWFPPGPPVSESVPLEAFKGCEKLKFLPEIASRATAADAESASGLDFELDFEDKVDHVEGLIEPDGLAQSDLQKAVVTLPEGMTVDPSVAEGLGVCTPADLARETIAAEAGEGCPNASKLGAVSVRTPLLAEEMSGDVFLAQQDDPATPAAGAENPFDSLIAFYIVLKDPELGVLVKVPAKVEPDPRTGQLVTTVEDVPEIPFADFRFHFREGQRAPLITPAACGTYATVAELTPRARPGETLTRTASFQITRGVGGGPCPAGGIPPFGPGFQAGSLNNAAAAYSPFDLRLLRRDGEQDMTRFSAVLPPGVVGKLAGVGKCADSRIALAKSKSGRAELAAPSCPAGSKIGTTLAGAGVGSALTYVPGGLYLAGPYHGDPLSVVAVTPAVAGPFDVGTVVVRVALRIDPRTAEVHVDSAASDPIPHILAGIPLKLRDLRVNVDRPQFTLNPTSCDPSRVRASVWGSFLDVFSPADDVPVGLSSRYQAADCSRLAFKPRLGLRLKGGTRRGAHPALRAVLRARPGQANIAAAVVRLPRSAFLEQAHIRTVCTRVQFAAGPGNGAQCPAGAVYGRVTAYTPLLDEPLQGPVFLRSSNHKLPDLVFALHGIVDVEASARIDSLHGGIRTSFEAVPDVPVSKVVLRMQGGKKGLIVNSRGLCSRASRAAARFEGHNGKARELAPPLRAGCSK